MILITTQDRANFRQGVFLSTSLDFFRCVEDFTTERKFGLGVVNKNLIGFVKTHKEFTKEFKELTKENMKEQ